jgi:hypothetical protein
MRGKGLEPTYQQYKYIMRMLFEFFDTFSKNPCLLPSSLEFQFNEHFLNEFKFNEYRSRFAEFGIQNTLNMLEETHTENRFRSQMQSERTYRAMTQDISMLIMPEYSKDSYRFVYLRD